METTYIQLNTSDNNSFITSDNNNFFVKHDIDSGFSIELFKNSSESNRVDKTNYIELINIIAGTLRESCSIISPVLTIEYPKVPDFNYVYIEAFGRYYFVTGVVSVRSNLWEISLECDVLMSHKDKLLECRGFVDRNEKTFDGTIVDSLRPIQQGQNISVYRNNINYVFSDVGSYILTGSVLGMANIKTRIYFDSGVTVTVNGTNVESGSEFGLDPTIKITSTKAKTYINNVLRTSTSSIDIDGRPSLYIKTDGADVEPYEITINWVVSE